MSFVQEFLYRGNANDTGAWHVVLGNVVEDGFGGERLLLTPPMTPAQATTAGFPLPAVIVDINTATLAEVEALQAQVAELQAALAAAQAENT